MRAFGMQLSCAMILAVAGSGSAVAMPDAPEPDAGEVAKPALYAAYQEDAPIARSLRRVLYRGQFESMTELVDSLLGLIPALTQYRKPDSQPPVLRVTRAQIEEKMCGGSACPMRAWYLPDEGIFLEDNLHPETDLFDRSVLFHELVHYLQELNAEGAALDACNRWFRREIEAYGLQNQYLALTGNGARVTHPGYPCRDSRQVERGTSATERGFREDGSQALAH
jgi:hypothetical protein